MLASCQSVCLLQRLTIIKISRALTEMVLFLGLAAEVHYQSGFAPSPAGFHQTPPHTSHSNHQLEVTGSAHDTNAAAAPCQSWGKPGRCGSVQLFCTTSCCNFSRCSCLERRLGSSAGAVQSAGQPASQRKLAYNRNSCHRATQTSKRLPE